MTVIEGDGYDGDSNDVVGDVMKMTIWQQSSQVNQLSKDLHRQVDTLTQDLKQVEQLVMRCVDTLLIQGQTNINHDAQAKRWRSCETWHPSMLNPLCLSQ